MKMTLRTLSALLGYPSDELKVHAGELRMAIDEEEALSAAERDRLEPLLRALADGRICSTCSLPTASCSTVRGHCRCTCSSMSMATIASAARR